MMNNDKIVNMSILKIVKSYVRFVMCYEIPSFGKII